VFNQYDWGSTNLEDFAILKRLKLREPKVIKAQIKNLAIL
jgi:hypothetical protein